MANLVSHPAEHRRRLLITGYHYDRAYSMESRLSWQRAQHAAREYDVTVICAREEITGVGEAPGDVQPVDVNHLPLNRIERALMSLPGAYYLGYRLWHRRVFRRAQQLHAHRPFNLVHHVSFCGYREPSDGWRLGVPFVWGPIGGTQLFPVRFLNQLDPLGAARELIRNMANYCQLRLDRRVRRAARSAASVLAANGEVASSLRAVIGVDAVVQLETGVDGADPAVLARRKVRDDSQPLRILWSGRLQPWKGLPLLLRALAKLPAESRYTLRILGQGPCQRRWQRLAARLGVGAHIEWAGWAEYPDQLAHYQWADVFAFTSLRDTSGTGLLEALAAGAPIIGLNHQGAADVMSDCCAIAVSVSNAADAIDGFRDAVARLAADRPLLRSLSEGAVRRAEDFAWDRQWNVFREIYHRAEQLRPTQSSPARSPAIAPAERRRVRPLVSMRSTK
jgi:glycosyltransferase involved in cell wall biosynthesis